MTAVTRRSPILAPGQAPSPVVDAIRALEDTPRVPEKTPVSSSADGYEGEVCADGNYAYFYRNGSWKRASLSSF